MLIYFLCTQFLFCFKSISKWGVWSEGEGVAAISDKLELRGDLSGVVFRTATLHSPPYNSVNYVNRSTVPVEYKVRPYNGYMVQQGKMWM